MKHGRMVVAFLLLAGIAGAEVVERIVAKVNREIITKTELDDMVQVARTAQSPPGGDDAKLEEQVLDRMITDRLIIQAAKAHGLKVNDSEVEPQVEQELDALKAKFPSFKEYEAQLRKEGITYMDLRKRYMQQMKERFLYVKMLNLQRRQAEGAVLVTDAEIQDYYDAHKDEGAWKTSREVRARHIQFSVDPALAGAARKAKMAEASKRLKAAQAALKRGDTFAEVARSLSEDLVTRDAGGDLGRFGPDTYHESLERVVFALQPGQVSEPVESPVGLHLIKVEEVLEPRLKTLADSIRPPVPLSVAGQQPALGIEEMRLSEYIRAVLRHEKMSQHVQTWMDGLRSRALVQRFLEEPAKL